MNSTIEAQCRRCRRAITLTCHHDCPSECLGLADIVVCNTCAPIRGRRRSFLGRLHRLVHQVRAALFPRRLSE